MPCNGPVGLPIVLPIYTNTATTVLVPTYATSVCNGSVMNRLWVCHNTIIETQFSPTLTHASWLYAALTPNQTPATFAAGMLFTPPRPRPRIAPAVIRAGRRAVRRSIDLYARFRGMDEVRRFLRGEEIEFDGELYKYRVKKTLNVLQQTMNPGSAHIPYSLRLVDKATDKPLASGCVVFPALPVIDQLLALSFHIEDDEQELLRTTNWSPRLSALPRPLLQAA